MKYLLKQHLHFKREGPIYRLYPNQFSGQIIKEANKNQLILDINKTWTGKYYNVNFYEILENDFKRLLMHYKQEIEIKREKFYNRPHLEQLILILKYIYTRNNRAKEVSKRYARYKAYDDKKEFLELALNIAKAIRDDNFQYGFQVDPGRPDHMIIYYFQLGKKQVSFHSDITYNDVPEFKGKWNGKRNESFPFRIVGN